MPDRWIDIQTDKRQMHRQVDRQTNIQTDRVLDTESDELRDVMDDHATQMDRFTDRTD